MIGYQYDIDLPVEIIVPALLAIAEHDDGVTENRPVKTYRCRCSEKLYSCRLQKQNRYNPIAQPHGNWKLQKPAEWFAHFTSYKIFV